MPDYSKLDTGLGSLSRSSGNKEYQTTEPRSGDSVGIPSSDEIRSYLTDSNFGSIGANMSDNDRFDIANALASLDIENDVTKAEDRKNQGRNDRAVRELTEQYYKKLGGSNDFNLNEAFGYDPNSPLGILNGVQDWIDDRYTDIGNVLDFGFDNTIGNLVGLVNQDAGQAVKDWQTGEDLAWIPSAAVDIGTWALPGSVAWKVPALIGKGLMDNRNSIAQAVTGRDQTTGEQLNGQQQATNALAAGLGTFLTAFPGAGVLKAAQRAGGEAANKGVKEAAEKIVQDANIPLGKRTVEERAADLLESAGKTPGSSAAAITPAGIAEADYKAIRQLPEMLDVSKLDNQLLPLSQPARNLANGVKGIPATFKNAISNVASKPGELVSGARERVAKQNELRKTADNAFEDYQEALKNLPKDADDAAKQAVDQLKGISDEARKAANGPGAKEQIGKLVEGAHFPDRPLRTILPGQAWMLGNTALQNSAALGADSQDVLTDLSRLRGDDGFYTSIVPIIAAGAFPKFNNRNIRAYGSPFANSYSLRADALSKLIQDRYDGTRLMTEDDMMVLDQILNNAALRTGTQNPISGAYNNVVTAKQEKAKRNQSTEEAKK